MTEIWTQAAVWLGLALIASLASIWLRVATALSEIVVGTIAQLIIGAALGGAQPRRDPCLSSKPSLSGPAGSGLPCRPRRHVDAVLLPLVWQPHVCQERREASVRTQLRQ
jgi:glutathione-regulated potassium-efflux system ancillary protein KefC